eukprot:COSAG06_NODE_9080_length_1992_cov_1.966191_2_plen_113_part_00
MWFAAFGSYQQHPWLLHLIAKLLSDDRAAASSLLAPGGDPFAEMQKTPRFIRARHYEYQFTTAEEAGLGATSLVPKVWWKRKLITEYLPSLSLDNPSLRRFIEGQGWRMPSQ